MDREIDLELVRSLAEFRRAMRAFLASSEALSKSAGITAVQYQALLAICAWQAPMALRDLADQLMLTHSAAVQTVDRLVATDLVARTSGTDDRRIVLVTVAPKGERLLARLIQQHLQELLRQEGGLRAALRRVKAFAAGDHRERGALHRG